jgi:aminoglycoside phosphotransferase (APT) family kinase protein
VEENATTVLLRMAPDAEFVSASALAGGVSAEVMRVDYKLDGLLRSVVIRAHGDIDLARNPKIASDEFRLLKFLREHDFPVAEPLRLDTSEEILGRPYFVSEFVEGTTLQGEALASKVETMAEVLNSLHKISLLDWPSHLWLEPRQAIRPPSRELDISIYEDQTRSLLVQAEFESKGSFECLLHGDYWAGNLLWRNESLVAVLDWEDFGVGSPLADLANARLELLWAAGQRAVDQFTERYLELANIDADDLPYWDLCATLPFAHRIAEFTEDKAQELRHLDQLSAFVAAAFAKCGVALNP